MITIDCTITKNDTALNYREFFSLENECFPSEPFNEIQFAETTQGDYWTARMNGNLIGFVNATTHEDRIYLGRLEVHAQFRKAGVGGLLVDSVIDFAKSKKAPCVTLTVRTKNTPAYNLYVKKGFEAYGYKNRYIIPVYHLSETSSVEFVRLKEGMSYSVSFILNGNAVGVGHFNYQIGGCKDFVLTNPGSDILNVLSSIKTQLKSGSENLYVMSEDLKTIEALKTLIFAIETEMVAMKYAFSYKKEQGCDGTDIPL